MYLIKKRICLDLKDLKLFITRPIDKNKLSNNKEGVFYPNPLFWGKAKILVQKSIFGYNQS